LAPNFLHIWTFAGGIRPGVRWMVDGGCA